MTSRNLPTLLAVCLVLPAAASVAHPQTDPKDARASLGQCYSRCILQAATSGIAVDFPLGVVGAIATPGAGAAPVADDPDDDSDGPVDFFPGYGEYICSAAQTNARILDGCRAGCQDIERAYGVRRSEARKRFLHLFDATLQPLIDSGLWVDYASSPTPDTPAFDTACGLYLHDQGGGPVRE